MARAKIALIGAGMIGGTLAHVAAREDLGDIVMFDIFKGPAQGKALDLNQASAVFSNDSNFKGTDDYADIAGAAAEVEGKTEMDAMVAYLQVLGTMAKLDYGVSYRD